jgi:multidrug transporter EmrE-like cation transporter
MICIFIYIKKNKGMITNYWIWLAIIFNILTNIGFKYAAMVEKNPPRYWAIFIGSLVFGFLNSYCFTESLRTISLNTASAVFFSLTIVGLCLMSYFWFHEAMNWKHITGTFVIIAGVVLINAG